LPRERSTTRDSFLEVGQPNLDGHVWLGATQIAVRSQFLHDSLRGIAAKLGFENLGKDPYSLLASA
jgi:hypothetical protein